MNFGGSRSHWLRSELALSLVRPVYSRGRRLLVIGETFFSVRMRRKIVSMLFPLFAPKICTFFPKYRGIFWVLAIFQGPFRVHRRSGQNFPRVPHQNSPYFRRKPTQLLENTTHENWKTQHFTQLPFTYLEFMIAVEVSSLTHRASLYKLWPKTHTDGLLGHLFVLG